MEFVASLSQGCRAAAHCGLFTHKSVPVIFEPPFINTGCDGTVEEEEYTPVNYKICISINRLSYLDAWLCYSRSI